MGGSFQSLYHLLEKLDRDKYIPLVLFPIRNQALIDKLAGIGVSTVIHPFPSMGNSFNLKYRLHIENFLSLILKKLPFRIFNRLYPIFSYTSYSLFIAFDFLRFYIKKILAITKIPDYSADLVHINSIAALFGYYYVKKYHCPVVWHIREQLPETNALLLKKIYAGIFKAPSIRHLVCISENEARPFPHEKTRIVHNFYRLDRQPFPTGKRVRFLALGSLSEEKGFWLLIDAVKHLSESYSCDEFQVHIMGLESKQRMPFEKNHDSFFERIRSLNIQQYVKRLTPTPHIPPAFFASIHVLVRPSLSGDPWGRDIIEAMSTGRPVIATGRYDKFVKNGVNGFLLPASDHRLLAGAMEKFLVNRELIQQMGQRSFKFASALFDPDENTNRIEKLYAGILDKCDG